MRWETWASQAGAEAIPGCCCNTPAPAATWKRFWLHVVFPTAVGAGIYLLFRTPTLLVFRWLEAVSLSQPLFALREHLSGIQLCDWLLYSLPDGIWVYASTAWIAIIWGRSPSWIWLFVPVALAVGGEVGQAIRFVPGTYQHLDMLFYVGGFLLALQNTRVKP